MQRCSCIGRANVCQENPRSNSRALTLRRRVPAGSPAARERAPATCREAVGGHGRIGGLRGGVLVPVLVRQLSSLRHLAARVGPAAV